MLNYLQEDLRRNFQLTRELGGNFNIKGLVIVTCFRIAQFGYSLYKKNLLGIVPYLFLTFPYRILFEGFLGIEIHPDTEIGSGLVIFHGQGIVIHKKCKIGCNCTLWHGVTLGTSLIKANSSNNPCVPVIGNNCSIATGAIIIGDVSIGDGSVIGAGAVVTKSVPSNTVAIGNAARVLESNLQSLAVK